MEIHALPSDEELDDHLAAAVQAVGELQPCSARVTMLFEPCHRRLPMPSVWPTAPHLS